MKTGWLSFSASSFINWLPTLNLKPIKTACRLQLSFYLPKTNRRVGNRKLGKFFPSVILELITLQFCIVSLNNYDRDL